MWSCFGVFTSTSDTVGGDCSLSTPVKFMSCFSFSFYCSTNPQCRLPSFTGCMSINNLTKKYFHDAVKANISELENSWFNIYD